MKHDTVKLKLCLIEQNVAQVGNPLKMDTNCAVNAQLKEIFDMTNVYQLNKLFKKRKKECFLFLARRGNTQSLSVIIRIFDTTNQHAEKNYHFLFTFKGKSKKYYIPI